MPIIQINVWICEVCGLVATQSHETTPYSDPVVIPPERWGYVGELPNEKLACSECLAKEGTKH